MQVCVGLPPATLRPAVGHVTNLKCPSPLLWYLCGAVDRSEKTFYAKTKDGMKPLAHCVVPTVNPKRRKPAGWPLSRKSSVRCLCPPLRGWPPFTFEVLNAGNTSIRNPEYCSSVCTWACVSFPLISSISKRHCEILPWWIAACAWLGYLPLSITIRARVFPSFLSG